MDSKRKRPATLKSVSSDIESASSSSEDETSTNKAIILPRNVMLKKSIDQELISRQDLAVNKTKVDAVDAWFKSINQNARLLLLNGPSGAGKSATLLSLAAENGFQVLEWINPVDQNKDLDGQSYTYNNTSQAGRFEDFLLCSGRYASVIGPATKKLILVQEFPHVFNMRPELFHNMLRRYVKVGLSPIVFIMSVDNHLLFPAMFISDVRMENISFNAVARGALGKAIDRIARLEGREDVSFELRDAICDASHGDLRNAVIAWQFQTGGLAVAPRKILRRDPKRRVTKKKDKTSSAVLLDSKDELSEFLPSVGRIIYAKRGEAVPGSSSDFDPRGYLKTDPQHVIDVYCSDAGKFLALAHENYMTIFSDIHSVMLAAECLSYSDIIMSEWRNENVTRELGFSVGVRGLMNSCNKPIAKWAPLRKSKWLHTSQKAEEHVHRVKHVYALNCSSTQAILLDIIPMTATLRNNPYGGIYSTTPRVCNEPASPEPTIDEDSDSC